MKLKKIWPALLFLAAFAVCAIVFAGTLSYNSVLQAPDAMPSFGITSLLRRMLPWLNGSGTAFTHDDILKLLPSPAYHELSFIASTALLALAMGVYLRTIGLPAAACFAGGMAMAFSGYHFTLFNAGHRGYFVMMPYAVFMFALIERCIHNPRWFHFALLAICANAGLANQPDVFTIILMLLCAYALFRFVQTARRAGPRKFVAARWKRYVFGIIVAVVVFGAFGYNTVSHVFGVALAGREKQIAGAVGASGDAEADAEAGNAKDKDALWIFATNWSLPPKEMSEFIAPCIRGIDSFNWKARYWGEIGRSYNWNGSPDGLANYRQHTIYLGAIQLSLALFALVYAFASAARRKKTSAAAADDARSGGLNGIVFFWAAVAVVAVLFALGRNAPFYRLFYELPMMDKVRAPLKFVHLTEIAVSVLFACGLAYLVAEPASEAEARRLKIAGKISIAAIVIVVAGCIFASLSFDPTAHKGIWETLGIADAAQQERLARMYTRGFMRSAWLFAVAAAAIGAVVMSRPQSRKFAAAAFAGLLIAAVVLDMAEVGRRFVVPIDKTYATARNPLLESMRKNGPVDGLAFTYLLLTQQPVLLPFIEQLSNGGVLCADPTPGEGPDSWRWKTLLALNSTEADAIKRWKFWGVDAVLAPPQLAASMQHAGIGKITAAYDYDRSWRLVTPAEPARPMIAVVRPAGMPPPVAVYHGWRVAEADAAPGIIAEPAFDMNRTIVVSGDGAAEVDAQANLTPGQWVSPPTASRGNVAVAKANTAKPGMLMIRENMMRVIRCTAKVNGRDAPLYRANGQYYCVPVEAGESVVEIRPYISPLAIIWTAATIAFALCAALAYALSEYGIALPRPRPKHGAAKA